MVLLGDQPGDAGHERADARPELLRGVARGGGGVGRGLHLVPDHADGERHDDDQGDDRDGRWVHHVSALVVVSDAVVASTFAASALALRGVFPPPLVSAMNAKNATAARTMSQRTMVMGSLRRSWPRGGPCP